ncbi:MAG: RHS repeat-associated core domain-containing protein [Silanimonas lenta]
MTHRWRQYLRHAAHHHVSGQRGAGGSQWRVYDPTAGRFLQPDPLVQQVYRPQNWNPYAYAWNNPLRFTDPTGMFNVGQALRTIAAIAISVWMPGALAFMGNFLATVVSGFLSGAVSSGSLQGGLAGAFSAGLFFGIGKAPWTSAAEGSKGFLGSGLTAGAFGGKIVAHGMAGGVMSKLQGGNFGSGFASAGFAQAFSPLSGRASTNAGKVVSSALV